MPPFLPRKRLIQTQETSPASQSPSRKRKRLTDVLDDEPSHPSQLQAARNFTLGDDSESSLSEVDSDQFEDVPQLHSESVEDDQDEEVDWENTLPTDSASVKRPTLLDDGNLELNLSKTAYDLDDHETSRAGAGAKKGPTKIEREIRSQTHRMHVQFLLFHNAIRNSWICDKQVQGTLVKQLPTGITKEIEKWRVSSGLNSSHFPSSKPGPGAKGKGGRKNKSREDRNQRDWGTPSSRLESGKPDLSRGDPIIPLLKVLAAYWKKRFTITAPGLRKAGYCSAAATQRLIRSFRDDEHDADKHGERIESLQVFRKLAMKCQGSRDVGAQLFTALLRGIGIDSRLVASLQPIGFGWTKSEEAQAVDKKKQEAASRDSSSEESTDDEPVVRKQVATKRVISKRAARKGDKDDPINLNESSEDEPVLSDIDDETALNTTPVKVRGASNYDRDLPFPIYWTEVISPITSKVISVSSLVLPNPVASTPEILSTFEPRGAKAEKAKQVLAYVIAHSSDGSAKDVTTRYLKKKTWPGKTKGYRVPIEKVPVYNKRGKIKYTEDYDWFKSVMSGYVRTDSMRTAVDDVEDSTDLVPQQPAKKENKQDSDTLQSLKSSADFVLERFLRREEALRPESVPVRTFISGKGDKTKEENVFLRADVERCLSAESWHKEGRQVQAGEAPLKQVPIRAVTLTRKREVEEMQRQTGEKPTQGLYCWGQTEWIIPAPIEDGIIPKNSYGNIDCFVPSMVPRGAVHVPMRGTVRICKKLEIDYAEAVTGFEFGNKLAVPVIQGVVVAVQHEEKLREAWEEYAEQQRIKEEGKLEKAVLTLWKRMLMGLRIRERVSGTYGDDAGVKAGDMSGSMGQNGHTASLDENADKNNEYDPFMHDGGGFLLPDEDESPENKNHGSSELVVEDDRPLKGSRRQAIPAKYPTPVSIASSSTNTNKKATTSGRGARRSARRQTIVESGSDGDMGSLDLSD